MSKVSVKEFQRRIAQLDAQRTVVKPQRPGGVPAIRRAIALIILAIIAVAAFSNAHRTTPGISTTQHQSEPQMSDAEAQAKWNAMWEAASPEFKRGE